MSSGSGAAIADWALPPNGKPPGDDQNFWDRITAWWAEFTLQTKLLAIATLVVSLMMTGITFFALNGIQRDAVMNDCLLYTSPSPRDMRRSRMPSSA